jgi:hypothetical protein
VWTKNLSEYRRICAENPNIIPVFLEPWWLDAACSRGKWAPFVHEQSGTIWPVYFARKWGIPYAAMPPLTPRLGWWEPNMALPHHVPAPPYRVPYQVVHFGNHVVLREWFDEQGFQVKERGYFLREGPFDADILWEHLNDISQRQIKKAQKKLKIQEASNGQCLHELMTRSLERHGVRQAISVKALEGMVAAALEHGQGRVVSALDEDGRSHATAFFLWDNRTVYYLGGGLDERIKQVGASRLLLWEGLKWAAQTGRSFEFGGGNNKGVGDVYASMGGRKRKCYAAIKRWSIWPNKAQK